MATTTLSPCHCPEKSGEDRITKAEGDTDGQEAVSFRVVMRSHDKPMPKTFLGFWKREEGGIGWLDGHITGQAMGQAPSAMDFDMIGIFSHTTPSCIATAVGWIER